jgi:UDP-glucose 4-epimerase
MQSCVIGGAGFIGCQLVPQLLQTGRDVLVIGRRTERPQGLASKASYRSCDYNDRDAVSEILNQCDEIIDLAYATVPQTSFVDPIFDLQANLPATIGLLEAAKNLGRLRRILIVSSGGTVYGPVDRLPITEETTTSPVSPYGITKLTIERYALMYHRLHSVPVTIVRPANAYGIGQKPFTGQGFIATAMGHILQRNEVTIFGESGTIRDYLHVSDVASGIVAALEKGALGDVYNIGSGIGRDNRAVLSAIECFAEKDGYAVQVGVAPQRRFDVPANVLNFGRLLACSGWLPRVAFEDGIAEMWEDISRTLKDVN